MEHWSEKRRKLSINALRLWKDNPRINNDIKYKTVKDIINAIYTDNPDGFKTLLKSVSTKGFTYFDTVIVWKEYAHDDAFTVAEGNMRVAVLKVLLRPTLAPKDIKHYVTKLSQEWRNKKIEKLKVAIAPTLEDALPYIFDRHNGSFSITKWSKEAQHRFIFKLLLKEGSTDKIMEITGLSRAEIYETKSLYNLFTYAKLNMTNESLLKYLNNPRDFSFSTFDRFLKDDGKNYLGITITNGDVKVNVTENYFKSALFKLLENMRNGTITSRTINTKGHLKKIIDYIKLDIPKGQANHSIVNGKLHNFETEAATDIPESKNTNSATSTPTENIPKPREKNRLIPQILKLTTDNERLEQIFTELQDLPFKYLNSQMVLLRTFLELSMRDFIKERNFSGPLLQKYKGKPEKAYTIKNMLSFILEHNEAGIIKETKGEMKKFLDDNTWYGLDSLHKGTHSDNVILSPAVLQQYWQYIKPFSMQILDLKENK